MTGAPPGAPVRFRGRDVAMQSGLLGLDHAIVGVRDLEAARARYRALGFRLSPRGRHIGWGTANYCIMFERDYLELLGIVDPAAFSAGLDRLLADRQGLLKVVLKSEDAAATHAWAGAAGFRPRPVQALARILELPEGEARPEFRLVHLAPDATPGLDTFACEHLTPGLVWRAAWTRHANGARGVSAYWIAMDDPARARPAQERLWGAGAVTAEEGAIRASAAGIGALVFASPARVAERFGLGHPPPGGDGTPVAAEILVDDPDRAARAIAAGGIAHRRDGDSVLIDAPAAHGVVLRFHR